MLTFGPISRYFIIPNHGFVILGHYLLNITCYLAHLLSEICKYKIVQYFNVFNVKFTFYFISKYIRIVFLLMS